MEILEAKIADQKIKEVQNEMMEELSKEAIEHGNDMAGKQLKDEAELTIGQRLTYDLSKTAYEPIINNRFIVSFPIDFNILSWNVKSIVMPVIERRKCSNTVVVFRKFISPLTSKTISDMIHNKNFEISVALLDNTGKTVETWNIKIKKVVSVDFGGEMDYSIDSISEIKVVFETKDCILKA